jgi:microcompartment protein CcmK/EutM
MRLTGLSLFVGSLAAFALSTAAQSTTVTDTEVFLVGPNQTPLSSSDIRIRGANGQLLTPITRANGAMFFEDVGQKIRIEMTRRGAKTPYIDILLEPAEIVYLNGCINPATGEIKTLEQKVVSPPRPPKVQRRRMGGPNQDGVVPVGGAPVNDDCSGALPLACDSTVIADNTAATTDVSDPGLSCHFSGPGTQVVGSLWYKFVPTGTSARVHTEGSVSPADDSLIAVYSGTCGAFVELACSEDEGTGLLSDLTVMGLTVGETYYIQMGSFGASDQGAYSLSLECLGGGGPGPGDDNDECEGAILIECNTTVLADNSAASTAVTDPGLSCHFSGPGIQGINSIWYKFVPTGTSARIHTEGSVAPADDSLLGIYDGTCGALVEIGCSEDEGTGLLSDVTVNGLTAGNTYYIALSSFSSSDVGEYMLTVECLDDPPPGDDNDECEDAILLECDSTVIADNSTATTNPTDPGLSCHFSGPGTQGIGSIWYKFVATGNTARIHTEGSVAPADDSLLGIYDGECGSLVEIGCSEDEGTGLLSDVTVGGLTSGNTYYIALSSFSSGDQGAYMLSLECSDVTPLENDECEDAIALAIPSITVVDTSGATTDLMDGCDTVNPENNVWYTVTGTGTEITVQTCSVATLVLDTVINVFCDDCGDPLSNCVAGNDDDCVDGGDGFQSTVTWCSQAGVEYLVSVGGFGTGDAGIIEIETSENGQNCSAEVSCLPQGACCLENGTCTFGTEADCAAAGGEYLGDDTSCEGGNAVAEGGFEMGGASWAQDSLNFGTPLCTAGGCGVGGGTGPNSGDWWAWFGGIMAFESGSVSQSVVIPSAASDMTFWLEIPVSSANGEDIMEVSVDGNVLATYTDADGPFIGYVQQTVDVSGFANDMAHTVEFSSTITGNGGFTNFFVDDVAIAGEGVECRECFLMDFEGFDHGHAVGANDFLPDASIAGIGDDNFGAAIYDSNGSGADADIEVGQGGVLILQENGIQTNPGTFDVPDDAQLGGDLFINFTRPFFVDSLDLIDIDDAIPAIVTLRDSNGNERRYNVPGGFTANGAAGTLDTRTSDPQVGDSANATLLSSDAGYDESDVVQIEIELSGSAAVDNVVYCE